MTEFIVVTSVVHNGKLYLSRQHTNNLIQWRLTGVPMATVKTPPPIVEVDDSAPVQPASKPGTNQLEALFSLPPVRKLIEEATISQQASSEACQAYIEQIAAGGSLLVCYAKSETALNATATCANSWKALCDAMVELLTPVSTSGLQH